MKNMCILEAKNEKSLKEQIYIKYNKNLRIKKEEIPPQSLEPSIRIQEYEKRKKNVKEVEVLQCWIAKIQNL